MFSRWSFTPAAHLLVSLIVTTAVPSRAAAQFAGESVNMVSGTQWPGGDPFLQRQNEPSIAVSSANPMHLLAGANDYRTVDVPFVPGATKMPADAWQGVFKSYDGGQTWKSYLMPGYPQDTSFDGRSSAVRGPNGQVLYNASADPVVRAGTDGMFYFAGIVFARGTNDGRVVLNRFVDLNDKENGDPVGGTDSIQWVDASVIDQGGAWFADKPWIAVDVPRAGALTCTVAKKDASGRELFRRTFPGGALYAVWARIHSDTRSDVMFSRSLDCGATWSTPLKLNDASSQASQGAVASVDPRTGDVYVAWRRFGVPGANPPQDDAIFAARTFSKGNKFTRPRLLTSIVPFDQNQDPARRRFRTEALPTITSSVNPAGTQSWTHVAWAQRGANGDGQIVVSLVPVKPPPPSNDEDDDPCDGWKIPAVPLDSAPVTDDAGNVFTRGHQFMPQLTFSQGRIVAVYYDSRLDHTRTYYRPNDPCLADGATCWGPDARGRWYTEERGPIGERGLDLDWVLRELDDTDRTGARHTVDVRVAIATPTSQPTFTSMPISRMPFGARGDEAPGDADPYDPARDPNDPARRPFAFGVDRHIDLVDPLATPARLLRLQDLQVNPPNLPMFKNGTVPFIGDYIDVQGPMFVRTATGWAFDTQPTSSPVFHAVWTSNQDVVPPPDGDWTRYTPVGLRGGAASLVDPGATVPLCTVGYGGTRNQNIYTARISDGLFVTSPQNAKALNGSFPRNFVVSAFNATGVDRTFRFSFTPPAGVAASFESGAGAQVTSVTVPIPARSSAARTVFMKLAGGVNPATMAVNVTEVGGTLAGAVTLNPPGLTFDLTQPDGTSDSIAAGEVLTVAISAAHLSNANLSNANLSNANLSNANLSNANLSNANLSNANLSNATNAAAHLSNANLSNANLSNANLSNANLSNANLSNANLSNANLSNANLSNASVTDIDYTVTNNGNTTQAFDVRLLATSAVGPVQLIVSRTYAKPFANGCELVEQPDNQLVVNAGIVDPADAASIGAQSPLATFPLAPGETIQVTLRSFSTLAEARTLATNVAPVITPQGNPASASVALLVQNAPALPAAQVDVPYALPLQAIGGTGTLTWGLAAGSVLPDGLQIVGSQITGSPSRAGSFAFTLELTDEAAPVNLTQKDVTLVVTRGVTSTGVSTPSATAYFGDPVPLTATVSPNAGPTGTVTFLEGSNVLGTANVTAGSATLALSSLPVGPHEIVARYEGDPNWNGSTSSSVPVRIKVRTVLQLSTDPATPVFGGSVVLVATIDPLPPGAPAPTAAAQFSDGGISLGSGSFVAGVALSPPFLPGGGTHLFGVTFAGDANYDGASVAGHPVTVGRAAVAVDLSSDGNPSVYGAPVTFTARVTSPAGTPGGSVTFYDGTTPIGSAPLDLLGIASLGPLVLGGGSHAIQAYYEGTGDFAPDRSLTLTQDVTPAATTATLAASPNPSRTGQAVTFTCTVSSPAGSPTGAVSFLDGPTTVATIAAPSGSSATGAPIWTWTTSSLTAGSHAIACSYASNGSFGSATSATLTQTVSSATTVTVLTASPNPVREDKLVTLTATVTGTGGTPTGTVTFRDGTKVIGTATLSLGKATLSRKPGSEGSRSLTAVYGGSPTFASSTSAPVVLKVLEEYSCSAYKLPLLTGGTISSPSRSGSFALGSTVAVKWQFRKASGAYVSRLTAVKTLEAVYDALCNGKPSATAPRITLFHPATGPVAGSTFTYDPTVNQYRLSWNTAPASKGCWDIVLTPDNGIPQVATIVKLQ